MNYYNVDTFTKFDFEKGYVMKEKGNIVFIKILFSDIKKWNKILSNIFNKQIIIKSQNISLHKEYANKYIEFKKNFKVPLDYLNQLIEEDAFQVFNTQEQKNDYINKWKNKSI
jgi:hypothetical protein